MDVIEAIETRRSVRKFKEESIDREIVKKIVAACAYVPSWKNTQIVRYTFVDDRILLKKIAKEAVMGFSYNADTLSHAPAAFILSIITGRSGFEKDGSYSTKKGDRWQMFDAGIAAQTLCLAAKEYGVGTVILGIFDEEKIAQIIGLSKAQPIAAVIACGIPDEAPVLPKRKSVEELLTFR